MRIGITGATGLIGSALSELLIGDGHSICRITRRRPGPDDVQWDPASGRLDAKALEGLEAVVHLAGENVGAGRWTAARKRRIRESRVGGTRLLVDALASLERKPAVLVSASAIGIYGDRGDARLDERSAPGGGFLGALGRDWEASTEPAAAAGIRVAIPRFGVVLTPAGGALARLLPFFRLGVGGRLGHGRQWMPCVSIDDAVDAVRHALLTTTLRGPFNVTIPEPVTNSGFTRALASVLRRPAVIPVPAAALRIALGEFADATLLASARLTPERLIASGYQFQHRTVTEALRHVLGRA